MRRKNYPLAIEILKKRIAIKFLPESDWEFLGNIYEKTGQLDMAEQAYRQSSEIRPSKYYADFLVRHERHDEAVPIIEKILNQRMERMLKKDRYAWMPALTVKLSDWLSKWSTHNQDLPKKPAMQMFLKYQKEDDDWDLMANNYLIWYKNQK